MNPSAGTSYQGYANENNEITFFLNTQIRKRVSKKYKIFMVKSSSSTSGTLFYESYPEYRKKKAL